MTPLHLACENGDVAATKYLVDKKNCDATCKNNDGLTPLKLAQENGHQEVADYLELALLLMDFLSDEQPDPQKQKQEQKHREQEKKQEQEQEPEMVVGLNPVLNLSALVSL